MINLLRTRLLIFLLEHSNTWVSHKQTEIYFDDVELSEIMIQIVKDGLVEVRTAYGITFFRYREPNRLEMNCFTL